MDKVVSPPILQTQVASVPTACIILGEWPSTGMAISLWPMITTTVCLCFLIRARSRINEHYDHGCPDLRAAPRIMLLSAHHPCTGIDDVCAMPVCQCFPGG